MNDYLVFIGYLSGGHNGTPLDHPPIQITAESPEQAVGQVRVIAGEWSAPVFVVPSFAPQSPPDRRGLRGATVIRGPMP